MPEATRLRARFWILAAGLIPLNAAWVVQSEVFAYAGHPTTISLFYNLVFWLCFFLLVNAVLRRVAPRAALTRSELLALYAVLGVTSGLAGHDLIEVLLPVIAFPAFKADATNNWVDTLLPGLPPWLIVSDRDALTPFYQGHARLYVAAHVGAWALPVLAWSGFLGVLVFVMLCLNVLLRKQWTERERLAFPLVQLPLEITTPGAPLLRTKGLWIGFALAASLQLWNGIATLTPTVPLIPTKYQNYGGLITDRPWSAIGWLPVSFYPFAIALGVLLPLDLSFSSWFFFWFWKGQYVVAAARGWDQTPGFPFVSAQSLGAYLAIAVFALWGARHHLARVVRLLFDPAVVEGEEDAGPIGSRAAAWGVAGGLGALFVFCYAAGMTPYLIGAFFVIYLAIGVAITRMRAELGLPVHDLHQAGPNLFLPQVLGPSNLPQQDLEMFALFHGFNRAYRGHAMPIQLESFRMSGAIGAPGRSLFVALALAGFVGPLAAFWVLLHLCYDRGAAGALGPPNVLAIFGGEAWNQRYSGWVKAPPPPQANAGIALVVGSAFVALLNVLRVRVIGFPLHPAGYAVASSWGMSVLWVPLLLAWGIKLVLLRYGGLALYRRLLPFFYGVILGECVLGSLWNLLGIAAGIPTYGFWP